ncbi:MAG: hexitol phosphatase HxpB [Leptospiraceae bacterium]|nr:hexitol phosphatase HxpB [Leptospiraceae bacterium]
MSRFNPETVRAAVFDMDGLIIDSEPIWQNSEIKVFSSHGLQLTREDCMQTMGLRIDEVVEYWKSKDALDTNSQTLIQEILDEVIEGIQTVGRAMPGAPETIRTLHAKMPIALASSSFPSVIEAALNRLQLRSLFSVVHSAQKEKRGKPAPDVYITACEMLRKKPEECMALEDSPGGVLSALGAGMQVVAVPHPDHRMHPDIRKAHLVLDSLKDFSWPLQ